VFPPGPGRWVYLLEAIAFHAAAGAPDDAALLTGLSDSRPFLQTADLDFLAWSSRVPIDQPTQPHPWIDLVVPMSAAQAFLEEVQRTIAPIGPGDRYNLLLIPLRASTFTRPLFRTHDGELGVGFDTLRSVPAGSDLAPLLAFNRQLYDLAKELGGSQYPISAVELDEHDWEVHYGEEWERLRRAKRRYDRDDVLASGPDVLGRC
jgi:cytokinin dehydrogenase